MIRRVIFLLLAFVGLGLVITKPQYTASVTPRLAHILTANSEISSYQLIGAEATTFTNIYDFLHSDIADKTNEVHIHGQGLHTDDIQLLEGYHLILHPSKIPSGISDITVPNITEREQWILSGHFRGENVTSIFLKSTNNVSHKAIVTDSLFQIKSIAPVAGSYLVEIGTVLNNQDTIIEQLPIEVAHEPTWQMLVLSSYPMFEHNYLKSYWTSLGNGFSIRTKISKEKYRTSFVNTTERNLTFLSQKILSNYDFVIADIEAWNQLSTTEKSNIKKTVYNNGLALLIKPSDDLREAEELKLPTWNKPKDINWKTSSDESTLIHYSSKGNWRSTKLQGHTIARYRSNGLGHIALLCIDETYKLILANETRNYQNLWSNIFSNLYRDFSPTAKLSHDPWIWANRKTTLSILSDDQIDKPPLLNDSISLPYLKVPFLAGVTEMTTYPKAGFNTITYEDSQGRLSNQLRFYAHGPDSWPTVQQIERARANQHAANRSKNTAAKTFTQQKEIPIYYWYLLVLLGFGLLWLDERVFAFSN